MSFNKKLKEKYDELGLAETFSEITESRILKVILEPLLMIMDGEIDESNSSVTMGGDSILNIRLVSYLEKHIPVHINVSDKNIVNIQLENGLEYLYMQEINSEDELKKLAETINDLLTNDILSKSYVAKGKLKKVVYELPYKKQGKVMLDKYTVHNSFIWFWEKVNREHHVFERWVR